MKPLEARRPPAIWVVTLVAVAFGLLTIKSGGLVLFVDGADRQAAGNYVPFVLWFNFLAGFAYVAAGLGLWAQRRWAAWLAIAIAAATLAVYGLFGVHIQGGGAFEPRTVIAMSARSTVWVAIAIVAYRRLLRPRGAQVA